VGRPRVLVKATSIALLIALATSCSNRDETAAPRPTPKRPSPTPISPSPVPETPSPRPPGDGPVGTIALENLTSGHAEATPMVTTEPIDPPADTLVLAHVMGFRPGGLPPPVLRGNDLTWTLVGGNQDGEKRHWVFRGVGSDPLPGPLTIDWGGDPTETLWVVDLAEGTAIGNEAADAVVQFAFQESQQNASSGSISLQPFADPLNDATVCFALAGSGHASDIAPADGFSETAEAQNPGPSLIISVFWKRGEGSCDADFLHVEGTKQIQSWLFLALELRAANT
jgi:hypothetical protein